ncbi:MAG TPA: nucleotide exchange factor GrpE [Ignavibacteriaceae bacterium]|nr:nucleotide exchange factor GrpE [Ignavibacteriaceae bacterium]
MSKKHHDKESKEEKIKTEKSEKEIAKDNENSSDGKIESLENEIEELKDKLLRKAAEFENYKRRTENDQINLIKYGGENLILKLLPVIDDFERSMQHMENAKDVNAIKDGIKLVYDKLIKMLNDQGIKKIEAVGKPFDVDYHEALMQRKDDNFPPHTVLDELEKGYMYKDRVIRHSKVIVSEELTEENTQSPTDDSDNNTKKEDN